MKTHRNSRKTFVLLIFFIPGCLHYNFRHWTIEKPQETFRRVITWDNFGYFLWLPAFIIHQDPWLQGAWLDTAFVHYQPSGTRYQLHEGIPGRRVSIYHPGMAIASLPAFFVGHGTALLFGAPADGFSLPYRVAYVLWFFFLIYRALRWLLDALETLGLGSSSFLFLALLIAASNLPATLGNHGVFIHTVGFFLMAGLLKLWLRVLSEGLTSTTLAWLSAWCGLAFITRPPLVLWLLIFLPSLPEYIKQNLFRNLFLLLLAFALALLPPGLLMLYWREATGQWTLNLHTEVFNFNRQRLTWFLFSARNGWLFYSPVFLLIIPAWIIWLRQDNHKRTALWAISFLGCLILHGSWECWHYGGGYGQRTMTDYYPMLMVPLALAWRLDKGFKLLWVWFFRGILGLLALINLFQTLQFFTGALTPQHNTWAYYRCQFLRLFPQEECRPFLYVSPPASLNSLKELDLSRYDTATIYDAPFPETGEPFFAEGHEFSSPGIDLPYLHLSDRDHLLLWLKVQKAPSPQCYEDSLLAVAYLKSRGRFLFYQAKPLEPSVCDSAEWRAGFVIPENFSPNDSVRLYLWNRKRCSVLLYRIQLVKAVPRMPPTYVVR